ncbi:MAG: amidase family protein [Ottowia sp.]|jgi:amidase|uniref:amidase family protein n=1 Tax=Ottowia sp. TaxID=1898956 RepID=UPI001B402A05|nr:amidase family protein [Ottowia sp.]MBP6665611.1 amidase family protein [Ottowia sp.]MBP7455453.1 amidase family protein [Ottowia sp.]MBP7458352.1 amidase family protein [Ottowia sp.]MBP8160650.1 amidase family protein [Ottowia sp.]MBP8861348.1 amidase family protein [Ottowia sp.]
MPQPTIPDALWRLPASQTAALVRAHQVSATEVARAALARVDAVNPRLNAIVECRPDEVLARAAAIDAALARGEDPGPLAGVPITTKVNVDQAGYATTNGLKSQKDLIATEDAPMVRGLMADGAVLLGRTNVPAFCYRWFTSNQLHGRTLNPRNAALTPGGSSGGAASAVAAGLGAIAHGTDIAGSVRYPAYACGVHGLRPSLGRVANFNATAPKDRSIGGQIMAVSGPLARTVDDLRLGLAAMARPDTRDPWYAPVPLSGPDLPRRAAVCLRPDGMATAPEICAALLDSADRLRDAGWVVDEVDALPPLQEAVPLLITLWMGDGYDAMVQAAEAEGDPGAIAALAGQAEFARGIGLPQYSDALVRRATLARAWQRFLAERYSAVLLPLSAELPFEDDLDLKDAASYQRVWSAQMSQIALPLTGLPALALTTGNVGNGVPVGIQIVAARFREDVCLGVAEAIEARLPALAPALP